jgi:hypothetical protein
MKKKTPLIESGQEKESTLAASAYEIPCLGSFPMFKASSI